MAIKRKWHVILSHTDGRNLFNLSLNKTAGLIVFILLALLLTGMFVSAAFLIRYRIYFPQIEQMQAENRVLRDELDKLITELDSVMIRLKQMEEWEDQLRAERNIQIVSRELRQAGTGGKPQIKADFLLVDHNMNLQLNYLWYQMDELRVTSNYAYELRKELVENVSLQEEMYRFTPSIYPTFGRITTPYGWRTHPITRKRDFHSGIDFANRIGSPIYATADGVVKEVGSNRFLGRYIIITHKFGYETLYGHLDKFLVERNGEVHKGKIIGIMGNTGRSTGSHLHYEVRRYGRHLNPYHYLNKLEEEIIITQR